MPTKSKNSRTKLGTIAPDTIAAIRHLHEMFDFAEKHLKKLPGAREPEVRIDVTSVVWHPDHDEEQRTEYDLAYNGSIVVERYEFVHAPDGDERELCGSTPIADFNTSTRINLAKRIPDLIYAAKNSELKVKSAAEEAAAMIEQAISETMEDNS